MLRTALLVTALVVLASGTAQARRRMYVGGPVGLGVAMGAPTALTLDVSVSRRWDIDVAAGKDPSEDGRAYGHLGITVTVMDLVREKYFLSAPLYVGLGVTALEDGDDLWGDLRYGVRVPFGIAADTSVAPFRIYLELAPRFDVTGDKGVGFSGVIGFRFFPGGG